VKRWRSGFKHNAYVTGCKAFGSLSKAFLLMVIGTEKFRELKLLVYPSSGNKAV
jgi:hypothetical protein